MTDETTDETTIENSCATCIFYRAGTCRAKPPQLRYRGSYSAPNYSGGSAHGSIDSVTMWPKVRAGDWCGDHCSEDVQECPW